MSKTSRSVRRSTSFEPVTRGTAAAPRAYWTVTAHGDLCLCVRSLSQAIQPQVTGIQRTYIRNRVAWIQLESGHFLRFCVERKRSRQYCAYCLSMFILENVSSLNQPTCFPVLIKVSFGLEDRTCQILKNGERHGKVASVSIRDVQSPGVSDLRLVESVLDLTSQCS